MASWSGSVEEIHLTLTPARLEGTGAIAAIYYLDEHARRDAYIMELSGSVIGDRVAGRIRSTCQDGDSRDDAFGGYLESVAGIPSDDCLYSMALHEAASGHAVRLFADVRDGSCVSAMAAVPTLASGVLEPVVAELLVAANSIGGTVSGTVGSASFEYRLDATVRHGLLSGSYSGIACGEDVEGPISGDLHSRPADLDRLAPGTWLPDT